MIRTTTLGALALAAPMIASADPKPALNDFMGINGHSTLFRPTLYDDATTMIRDYHNLSWDISSTNPRINFSKTVNWNNIYNSWAAAGYRINTAIQFNNADLNTFGTGTGTTFRNNARAYGRAFAQQFGSTAIGGNGLVTSVQIGNEPGDVSDTRYKELFKAMAAGIREVDPSMLIVSCNVVAGPSHEYAKSLTIFEDPTVKPLVDVLATHSYPFVEGWPTWRRSHPEDPSIAYLTDIQNVINWRDTNGPAKQVWLTEFGYDATTGTPDPNTEFRLWEDVTDTQQAQYITRSFLTFTDMDLDRAYLYWANDDDKASLHASSGITRGYVPKPSYWAMKHLKETLGDYRFNRAVEEITDDLYIYEFVASDDPDDLIWAIWSPTGHNRETLVTLDDLAGDPLSAERMPLADGAAPIVSFEELSGGRIRLLVGESPVYLRLAALPEPTVAGLMLGAGTLLIVRRRRPTKPTGESASLRG